MDENTRLYFRNLGKRCAAMTGRFGFLDLHLVAVEFAHDAPVAAEIIPPPVPIYLEGIDPLKVRQVVYQGNRSGLWYFGEPSLFRAWDQLCYQAGEAVRQISDLAPQSQRGDWLALSWLPLHMIGQLTEEKADHLIRRIDHPGAGPGSRAVWLADDVFSLSAMHLLTLAYPWAVCSQADLADFLEIGNRSGLLDGLASDPRPERRIEFRRINRTTARVRFLDQSVHTEFLDWLREHRANAK